VVVGIARATGATEEGLDDGGIVTDSRCCKSVGRGGADLGGRSFARSAAGRIRGALLAIDGLESGWRRTRMV
jgi:hypothetical protein